MIKDIISFENTIGWEIRYQYIPETKEFIKLNFSKTPLKKRLTNLLIYVILLTTKERVQRFQRVFQKPASS